MSNQFQQPQQPQPAPISPDGKSQWDPAKNKWVPIKKKSKAGKVIGFSFLGILAIILIAAIGTSGGGGQATGPANEAAAGTGGQSAPGQVVIKVDGKAPKGVDITYGTDSDNSQGGNSTGWQTKLTADDNVMYYYVTAQLQGSGNLECSITIGDVTAKGTASGQYNICEAQLMSNGFGGWEQV